VHPTLGILARFQAFFYASAFFQSDGVPPPAPARVTQTVGKNLRQIFQAVSKIKLRFKLAFCVLQIRVLVFSKVSVSIKSGIFSGGNFPSFGFLKIGSCFWFKKFRVKFAQVSKIGLKVFMQSFCKQAVSFFKVRFSWLAFLWAKSGL